MVYIYDYEIHSKYITNRKIQNIIHITSLVMLSVKRNVVLMVQNYAPFKLALNLALPTCDGIT